MSYLDLRFPTHVEQNAQGGPSWITEIAAEINGAETRRQVASRARHRFTVSLINTRADMWTVKKLFMMARGRLHSFGFRDWGDYQAVNEVLGTSTGGADVVQLSKSYDLDGGGFGYTRKITRPFGTIEIKVAGAVNGDWSLGEKGVITFTGSQPAGEVTASFEFDVPVRFLSDDSPITQLGPDLEQSAPIQLIEVIE